MDSAPILLGLAPALLFHATGAVTFVGQGAEPAWDDDAPALLAVAA
jgi:hypothetical protein